MAPMTLEGVNARVTELAQETVLLMKQEALASREAWAHSGLLSAAQGQIQAFQARDPTHANDPEGADSYNQNNMPPKRTSVAAARDAAVAALIIAVAVEQLIEARVSEAIANHETF
ncbi:hypothetical protein Tco_0318406 [Tanacetum coccineum]